MASRSYCWTINNPSDEEIKIIGDYCGAWLETAGSAYDHWRRVRYVVYGDETGKEGTRHLQGYLELHKPMRLAGVKKLPGFNRAHFEARKGTRDEAKAYCMKDGKTTEIGEWAAGGQGSRTDLKAIITAVKEGTPLKTMIEESPELVSRHLRMIDRYQALCDKEQTQEFRHVEVNVLWGDAGSGKSRTAREEARKHGDYFTVNTDDSFPFDGYNGEPSIVIDDFYGGIKYNHLLNVLDGHQLRVNVKGGHRYARWTRVYITSNTTPAGWYRFGLRPALSRRLTNVTKFVTKLGGNTMPPASETDLANAFDSVETAACDNMADCAVSDPEVATVLRELAMI